MTVTPPYPGIYIEVPPSLAHTITPAPTSIAVFVGYTNPFYPGATFGIATQLNSFADYQANFGGFFSWPWLPDYGGPAGYQFFQNGGPTCYVVALRAKNYYDSADDDKGQIGAANVTIQATGGTMVFTALQLVGVSDTVGIPLAVAISNLQSSSSNGPSDTADI